MPSLTDLARSFARQQRAEGKSPNTIAMNGRVVRLLAAAIADDLDAMTRRTLTDYFLDRLEQVSATTAGIEYKVARTFFRWCVREGELAVSPMDAMKPPKERHAPPKVYSEADLSKLLKACEGREFADKRDAAMVRLLIDTGMRRGELAGIAMDDLDLDAGLVRITGKTGTRVVPFGSKTALALDRYVRARASRTTASAPNLWLGHFGTMTPSGLYQALRERAAAAGVEHAFLHRFRHTSAHRWLSSGGTEGDAMQLFGWSSRSMLDRYGASAATERAIAAHRKLAIGDRL